MITEDNMEVKIFSEKEIEKRKNKFNFAAFIMPHIWGIANGVPIGLVALIPIAFPFVAIYLGIKGNELAYEKSYGSPERFFKNQKKWNTFAVVYLIVIIVLLICCFKDEFETYSYNKGLIKQCLTEHENNQEYYESKIECLTDEKYLSFFRNGIKSEALLETEFKVGPMGEEVLEDHSFKDLCDFKGNYVTPTIIRAYRYYELENGNILRFLFTIDDAIKDITEVEYKVVEIEEELKKDISRTIEDAEVVERGMYMDTEIIEAIFQSKMSDDEIGERIATLDARIAEEQARAEAEEIEKAAEALYKPNEDGYYKLSSPDGGASIEIMNPENFAVYDFTDEDSFNCYHEGSQDVITNFNAWITEGDVNSVEEKMISEIEITCLFGGFLYQGISETETVQIGDYEVSCFLFAYTNADEISFEEFRIWMPLDEKYFMCFSINKKVVDDVGLDFQECMDLILNNIRIEATSE